MTKTLTEQWREGTLPRGAYYVNRLGEVRIYLVTYEDDKNTHEIYEVLAPVPSYDEYQLLKKEIDSLKEQIHSMLFTDDVVQERYDKAVQKMHILEKRLAIATTALKEYAEEGNWCDCSDWNDMVYQNDCMGCCENGMFGKDGFKPAQKALKEMEGVK